MQRKSHSEVHWLQFDHLTHAGVTHGVFLRHGGVSQAPYGSLNAFARNEDDEAPVIENIRRIKSALKLPSLHSVRQVHGTNIVRVKKSLPVELEGDALICDMPGEGLMIKHADCQVALFYDPVNKVVAAAHSGWRGSVQNIYQAVIEQLKDLGCQPQDLLVGITPSLGPCHAEFRHYREELPETFWEFQVKPTYFDFWAITTDQLIGCGVLPAHIEIARQCTYANSHDFFSHRRDKVTGRHATVIML